MIGRATLCAICARATWQKGGPTCLAFPAGIPAKILEGPGTGGAPRELGVPPEIGRVKVLQVYGKGFDHSSTARHARHESV